MDDNFKEAYQRWQKENPRKALLATILGRQRGTERALELTRAWETPTERLKVMRLRQMERLTAELLRIEDMLKAFDPEQVEDAREELKIAREFLERMAKVKL